MAQNEADLIGYLFNVLDESTYDQVHAALADDAAARETLAQLELTLTRLTLLPLDANRDSEAPPPDLAMRTIGFVAEHLVRNDPTIFDAPRRTSREVPEDSYDPFLDMAESPSEPPLPISERPIPAIIALPPSESPIAPRGWRYSNVIIATSLAVLLVGMVIPLVSGVQRMQMVNACQNNLRELHASLTGYADTRNGALPMITGQPPMETAASFMPELIRTGYWNDRAPSCPSSTDPTYAYTLGYRDDAQRLHGVTRDPEAELSDHTPIAADRLAKNGVGSHTSGQNVLFLGGHVRFCNSPNVGVDGDSIYVNQQGQVAAGINRWDTVLGSGDDRP